MEQDLKILNSYKNDLDWLLYDLACKHIDKRTITYHNPMGKITIEVNGGIY